MPVHGTRHAVKQVGVGWFTWAAACPLNEADDSFVPMHAEFLETGGP